MLRPERETAQFMNRAFFCPVHELGKSVAQFVNWAKKRPVHELGIQIKAHFTEWGRRDLSFGLSLHLTLFFTFHRKLATSLVS